MRKIWKTPGLSIQRPDRSRNQDHCGPDTETRTAGPGEPTSEPATLQEKHGQARYGSSGQGGGRGTEKRKITGTALRARGEGGCKESERQRRERCKTVNQRSLA
ncbi:hypothetical protein NDU88_006165 [Pleurodeles waltl]|uniref:Uncharacterized protein n=1 Tax=Pleurodeles waltl TaxID=8319 RepID=A0AAV7VQM8_PLEWA|nr:hypothetical protein NDU88_006165 [Pleurodeles waltl]